MSNSTVAPLVPEQCYCDPSVVLGFCHQGGCTAFAAIYLIVWFIAMAEGIRRIVINRRNWKTAIYVSNVQLTIGVALWFVRHIMLLAKVTELYSMAVLLTFGVAFWVSAYLWILVSWCDIILSVNFSKPIQKTFIIVKYVILAFNVLLFVGWIIGNTIYWPYYITNIFFGIYGFGITLGFFALGLMIWREYYKVSHIAAHGQAAHDTYAKVRKVTMLATYVSIAAIIFTICLIASAYKLPHNPAGAVAWMFITRIPLALFVYTMLVVLIPNRQQNRVNKDKEWAEKMQRLEFSTNAQSNMYEETTLSMDTATITISTGTNSGMMEMSSAVETNKTSNGSNSNTNSESSLGILIKQANIDIKQLQTNLTNQKGLNNINSRLHQHYQLVLVILFFINISQCVYFKGYADIFGQFQNANSVLFSKDSFASSSGIEFQLVDDMNIKVNISENMVSLGMIQVCTKGGDCSNSAIWNPVVIDRIIGTPTEGGVVSVQGQYLQGSNSKLKFSKTNIMLNSSSDSSTELLFNFPTELAQQFESTDVNVTIQIRSTVFSSRFSFLAPKIDTISIDKESSLVHLEGSSFGVNSSLLSATIDGIPIPISNISKNFYVSLDTRGIKDYFSYAGLKKVQLKRNELFSKPMEIKIRPVPMNITTVSSDIGGLVTVYGSTFTHFRWNNTLADVSIWIGDILCKDPQPLLALPNRFTCKLGPVARNKQTADLVVKVIIDGAESNKSLLFSFDIPALYYSKQNVDIIELTGERLGFSDDLNKTTVYFRDFTLTPLSITMINNTGLQLLKFRISNATAVGIYKGITLKFKHILSNPVDVIISPVITDITSPPTTGGRITISGVFLNTKEISKISIIGDDGGNNKNNSNTNVTDCRSMERVTPYSIACVVGAGSGGNILINASMKGLSIAHSFSYQSPSVHSSTTINFFGGQVTVFGDNFAPKNLSVTIGEIECTDPRLVSAEVLVCSVDQKTIPSPVPIDVQNVTVTVNGLVGSASVFTYIQLPTKSPLDKQLKQLAWVIPIGAVAVAFVILTTIILSVRMYRQHLKKKAVKHFLEA
ncbi:immunoglobulin E-set domain-containing protein [Heterostelium album PN500]|uniref:Immunoglobulin E-set domain-containing protein n=1 Tax=Heterostelium pallidum (strain ATCC 26659 / Pp 5 / PN500) TaxID=670386 RepID=D3B1T2_HETP5|nr:immunoglobulin E-set domain-containing protein [Heterostelium album PN500]EFA85256.1 immunoglobulin E-set domain-containing protein [Heterostelium album PN500]|eukprot:XP_020437365.1 immunoglobulin E-set domain-containing protein [Heterostelium album PN500]